jgi:hypothetical protein
MILVEATELELVQGREDDEEKGDDADRDHERGSV